VSNLLVVEEFGLFAETLGETQDGVAADLTQPGRGADAAAVGEVLGDGHEFGFGCSQAEQGSVGAFGEVRAAGDAVQAADAVPAAGPAMQTQVAGAALGVDGAVGVRAGQLRVVLGAHRFPPFSPGNYHCTLPGTSRESLRSHHRKRRPAGSQLQDDVAHGRGREAARS